MSRTGLIVALGIAAVVGLVFGFFPQLMVSMIKSAVIPFLQGM